MKNIYFTVGPSQLYPTIEKHMRSAIDEQVGSMSHRGSQFHVLFESVVSELKMLLSIPKDYHIFFLSSGTEGMERTLENCVRTKSLHLVSGSFGERFYKTAQELGKAPQKVSLQFEENLGLINVDPDIEMLALTHNDTSTGISLPMDTIYNFKQQNPNVLVSVDVVSSVPFVELDYSLLDCVFFSVQKGFGLPAGLGVIVVSPRALTKSVSMQKDGMNIGTYHNFPTLFASAQKFETPETPNVLDFYLFNKVLEDMSALGVKQLRTQTLKNAEKMYDFFEKTNRFTISVSDPAFRSKTTIVLDVKNGSKKVTDQLKKKGLIVGSGYGKNKETQIRIANFPSHSAEFVEQLLSAIASL